MTTKIALVGVCQVVGMGEALKALIPGAEIHPYHVTQYDDDVDQFVSRVADFDLVISQFTPSHGIPELELDRLQQRKIKNLYFVPPVIFNGFHPDACLIMDGSRQLASPIQAFHSKILAAAFLHGLSVDRALRLFNLFVYAELGYTSAFECAKKEFFRVLAGYGFGDLVEKCWDHWMCPDVFMYTPLHPKVRVLASFATEVAIRTGLVPASAVSSATVKDHLAEQHIWPLYPSLEPISVPHELIFRTYRSATSSEAERQLSLYEFAARSFEIYSQSRSVLSSSPSVTEAAEVLSGIVR